MVAVNLRRFLSVTLFYMVLTYYCVQCQDLDDCESGAVPCDGHGCILDPRCCFEMFEQVEEGSVIGNVNIVSAINEILTSGGGSIEHVPRIGENFLVNETTGVVRINRVIDREADDAMTCLPLSINLNEDNVGSEAITIGVIVKDINDNSPTFEVNQFTQDVMEGTNLSLCVSTTHELEAMDIDDGSYGAITYSLAGDVADMFNIVDYEGDENCIRNTVILNREEVSDPSNTPVYSLTLLLVATDGGGRATNITLIINITDVNDNDPMFTDASLETLIIREDTMVGAVVRDLNATDLDYNSVLTFSIVDESQPFLVNSTTGELSVRIPLQPRSYNVEIAVTDSELRTVSNLIIEVEDVNKKADIELEAITVDGKTVDCIEEETVSDELLIVYIIDDEDNNNYLVTLSGLHTENFTATVIFQNFIQIRLSHPLDQETLIRDTGKSMIEMIIHVEEIGQNSNITQSLDLVLNVCGINDNKPFLITTEFTVPEEDEGSAGNLEMEDYDSGDDGEIVSFCIVSAISSPGGANLTTEFKILNFCNKLGLTYPSMDREDGTEYVIISMILTDGGNCSNIVNITIHVMDINDNFPIFPPNRIFNFNFSEGRDSTEKRLGQVTAEDADNGTNAEVIYRQLNHTDRFYVDNITGNVSTLAEVEFDREEQEKYVITIQAENVVSFFDENITPGALSEVNVTITVKDLNDSPPEWENKNNVLFITSSDAAVGSFVAEVKAKDPDVNPQIMYDIEGSVLFTIDMNGVIEVAADLTEQIGDHLVLLIADDGVQQTHLNITIRVNEPTSPTSPSFIIIGSVASVCLLFFLVLVVTVIVLICVYLNKRRHSVRLAKRESKYEDVDGISSPQRSILRQIPSTNSGFTSSRGNSANGNSRGVKFETTVKKFGYDYEHAVNNSSDVYVTQSSIHLDSSGDESSPITPPRLPTTSGHHPNGKIPMGGRPHLTNGAPRLSPIQENFLFTSHGMRRTHPIQDERYSDDSDGNSDDDSTLPDNASSTNAPLPSVRHLSHMAASPHSTPPGSHLAPHLPMAQISPQHQYQRSPDHSVGLNPPHHDELSIHSSSSESLTVTPPPIHSHNNQRLGRPSGRGGPYPAHMPEGYVMPPSSSSRYGGGPFMDRFTGTDFEDASTYASAELDEALHFRPDQEPGIFSLTATSSYDEESQL